jgi:hypothetical protein
MLVDTKGITVGKGRILILGFFKKKSIIKLTEIPEFHFIMKTVFSTRTQMSPFSR